MSFNVISFLKSALANKGAVPVADDNPLPTMLYDATTGIALSQGFTAQEITSKTTTLLKSGAGMIGSITINKTGSSDTITVYDALTATGTPIATITAPTVGMKFCEGYNFSTGLCIVTGGTTAGNYTVAFA